MPGPGTGNDHESGLGNLASEIHSLLVFHLVRLRPGRAENGDLADMGIRREKAEGVAQFAQRRLNHAGVAGVLYVGQQLERVFDEVGDLGFIVAAAFVGDEFLNAALQFQIGGGFGGHFPFNHAGRITLPRAKATAHFCALTIGPGKIILRPNLRAPSVRGFSRPKKGSELR